VSEHPDAGASLPVGDDIGEERKLSKDTVLLPYRHWSRKTEMKVTVSSDRTHDNGPSELMTTP
jgi:hypothetical protein